MCLKKRVGSNLLLNCQFSGKRNVHIYMSVQLQEKLFPSLNEGKNCRIFLSVWLPQALQLYLELIKIACQCLVFHRFFALCNIFPIIVNIDFFYFRDILMKVSKDYIPYFCYFVSWVMFQFCRKQQQRLSVWRFTENVSFLFIYEGIWLITH